MTKNAIIAVFAAGILTCAAAGCSAKGTDPTENLSGGQQGTSQEQQTQAPTLSAEEQQLAADRQKVWDLVQDIAESPGESSAAADYIAAHREQFDSIIAMGDDGLYAMFDIFEDGGQTGLEGSIMQSACGNMLGGETIGIDTENAQQWYDEFKRHVIRITNLNSVDFIRQNNPKSYVLLRALDFENKGYDSSAALSDDEVITANGVRPGMTYEQAMEIIGQPEQEFDNTDTVKSVIKDGIHYGFYIIDESFDDNYGLPKDGKFYLLNIFMSKDEGFEGSGPRDIKIGDDIQDVFIKFPIKDTTLRKWAEQKLYDKDGKRASMEFTTVLGRYRIYFVTGENVMNIEFDKQNKVQKIELMWEKA